MSIHFISLRTIRAREIIFVKYTSNLNKKKTKSWTIKTEQIQSIKNIYAQFM